MEPRDFVLASTDRLTLNTLCESKGRRGASFLVRRGLFSRPSGIRETLLCGAPKSSMAGSAYLALWALLIPFPGLGFHKSCLGCAENRTSLRSSLPTVKSGSPLHGFRCAILIDMVSFNGCRVPSIHHYTLLLDSS